MKQVSSLVFAFLLFSPLQQAKADEDACVSVYRNSTRNFESSQRDRAEKTYLFNLYCEKSGESKDFTSSASFSFPIEGIPIEASGDGNWSESELKEFCKIGVDQRYYESSDTSFGSYVVGGALDSFNQCLEFSRKEIIVTHKENPPDGVTIDFNFRDTGKIIDVHGVNADDGKIDCTAVGVGAFGRSKKVGLGVGFSGQRKDFSIQCKRIAQEQDGKTYYPPVSLVVSTSEGNYPVTMRAETLNGYFLASEAKKVLDAAITAKNQAQNSASSAEQARKRAEKALNSIELRTVYIGDQYEASWIGEVRSDCTNQPQTIIDSACTSIGKRRISYKRAGIHEGGRCGHTWFAVVCQAP